MAKREDLDHNLEEERTFELLLFTLFTCIQAYFGPLSLPDSQMCANSLSVMVI